MSDTLLNDILKAEYNSFCVMNRPVLNWPCDEPTVLNRPVMKRLVMKRPATVRQSIISTSLDINLPSRSLWCM